MYVCMYDMHVCMHEEEEAAAREQQIPTVEKVDFCKYTITTSSFDICTCTYFPVLLEPTGSGFRCFSNQWDKKRVFVFFSPNRNESLPFQGLE